MFTIIIAKKARLEYAPTNSKQTAIAKFKKLNNVMTLSKIISFVDFATFSS